MSQVVPRTATHDAATDANPRQLRALGAAVLYAPVWWALGINLVVYHASAFLSFVALVLESSYENRRIRIPAVAWMLLFVAAVYAFSIALNGPSYDAMRILAAINNLSYWVMGPMLIIVVAARFRLTLLPKILSIFPLLGMCNVAIAVVAAGIALAGVTEMSIPTPLKSIAGVLGETALVEYSTHMRLITEDYFSGRTVPRFNLYAPYPTAAGAFFMIFLPLLICWASVQRRLTSPFFLLLCAGHVLCLGMTLARMAVLALVASALIVFILRQERVVTCLLLCAALGSVGAPVLLQSADQVITAREGSSESRFALYRESIDRISGYEWIVGKGIRTNSVTQRMPYGSHSTVVSLLYRTGILGLGTFALMQMVLLVRWYRLKRLARLDSRHWVLWQALGIVFFGMGFWMLTEDIDVPQLLAFMYFSAIGIFEGFRRELLCESVHPPFSTTPRSSYTWRPETRVGPAQLRY